MQAQVNAAVGKHERRNEKYKKLAAAIELAAWPEKKLKVSLAFTTRIRPSKFGVLQGRKRCTLFFTRLVNWSVQVIIKATTNNR